MALQYKSTEVYLKPDVRFKSTLVAKFINNLMHEGKKSVAEKVFIRQQTYCKLDFPIKSL